MNIAIVYDGGIRDNGTPLYARAALSRIQGGDVDWFTEDPTAERPIPDTHDFRIHVDDGRDDLPVDNIPHPWGYWAVDSHLGAEIRIKKALQADIVWCAQKPFVDVLFKEGIDAKWLPLACEPTVHCTAAELAAKENRAIAPVIFDLAFVGHLQDPAQSNRLDFLDGLFKAFPNSWFAYGHFHEDMSRVYHQARLGINHAVRDDLNMRFFELASMGVPQLADRRMVGLMDLGFFEGEHYFPYDDKTPAIEMAGMTFGHGYPAQERRSRPLNALALVRASHTYHHRLCTMLEDIQQFLQRGGSPCKPGSSGASQP